MSLRQTLRDLRVKEDGTTLVELAICVAVFLLLFFACLDLGRLSYAYAMAEKATSMAVRMAATLPPACANVPQANLADTRNTARFGSLCTATGAVCRGETAAPISCSGSATNDTATWIFAEIQPLLTGTQDLNGQAPTVANLVFRYTFDDKMNFLGGPYVPTVTVEVQNLRFNFVSPVNGLIRFARNGTTGPTGTPAPMTVPPMSVSLPGEDLNRGEAG